MKFETTQIRAEFIKNIRDGLALGIYTYITYSCEFPMKLKALKSHIGNHFNIGVGKVDRAINYLSSIPVIKIDAVTKSGRFSHSIVDIIR